MKLIVFSLLIFHSMCCYSQELDWKKLQNVVESLEECDKPIAGYQELFNISLSTPSNCSECIEGLSNSNEAAFLSCPESFLHALHSASEETKAAVLYRFGVIRPPWELGPVLYKFRKHPILGKFVSEKFSDLIKSGTNQDGTPIDPSIFWKKVNAHNK